MKVAGRPSKASRGSALVEFALVTFLLMMVMLSTIEFERMLLVYTTVADSARAGARYAIVHGADATPVSGPGNNPADVVTVIKNFATAGLLDKSKLPTACPPTSGGGICVEYAPPLGSGGAATNTPGSRVTVTVSYPYDPFVGWFNTMLSVPLSSKTQGVICY